MRRVHLVVPDGIDDPTRPSGGNVYDRRVRDGLVNRGWDVVELAAAGAWPEPAAADLSALRAGVAEVRDGELVVVDGLVGSAAADVLLPHVHRLRLVPLVHMPLGGDGERSLLSRSAAVLATSHWTRRLLVEEAALPADLVHVVEPGVDMADPVPGTATGTGLLCVAAVTSAKGHDVLLDALAAVRDLPWRCTLVGPLDRDPELVDGLRRQAVATSVADRVRFAGACSDTEVDKAYTEADVLVLPSLAETYGMVVTEALAHGLPVIASAVGGVPEALGSAPGGTPGYLVPPGDADALAAALRRWLEDPWRRRRLRRAAGERRLTLSSWARASERVSCVLAAVGP